MMKALKILGAGKVGLDQVSPPELGEGQVLVKIKRTAISAGTEILTIQNAPEGTNRTTGYISAGVVEKVNDPLSPLCPGDRVFLLSPHVEYAVTDATMAIPIPKGVDFSEAAASYWAVPALRGIHRLKPEVYDDAAVVGQGSIGLMATQILRHIARKLVAVDNNPVRLTKAAELGADLCVNPLKQDLVAEVGRLIPEGPVRVLEASGNKGGLRNALEIVRPRGRVTALRLPADLAGLNLESYMYRKDLELAESGDPGMAPPREYLLKMEPLLTGNAASVFPDVWYFRKEIAAVLNMVQTGYLQPKSVISHEISVEQAPAMYATLCAGESPSVTGVIINWETAAPKKGLQRIT